MTKIPPPAADTIVTLRLDPEITAALQRAATKAGRELAEQIQWMLVDALGDDLPAAHRTWLRQREELVQQFALKAVAIVQAEGHRDDIIAEAGQRLLIEDPAWGDRYEAWIGGGRFAKGIKLKERINPMLGRRVKLLIGAATGKPFPVKQPSIFTTSSTLLPPKKPPHPSGADEGLD